MLHAPLASVAPAPIGRRPNSRRNRLDFEIRQLEAGQDLKHADFLLQRFRGSLRQRFTDVFGPVSLSASAFRWGDAPGELAEHYRPPHGMVLVAYQNGAPAGCVALRSSATNEGHAQIERLFVEPRFRRHGLGHELMQRAGQAARELGYRQLRFALPGLVIAPFAIHSGSLLIDACG